MEAFTVKTNSLEATNLEQINSGDKSQQKFENANFYNFSRMLLDTSNEDILKGIVAFGHLYGDRYRIGFADEGLQLKLDKWL